MYIKCWAVVCVHVFDCIGVGGSDNVGHIKYCCAVDVCEFSVVSVLVLMLIGDADVDDAGVDGDGILIYFGGTISCRREVSQCHFPLCRNQIPSQGCMPQPPMHRRLRSSPCT